ncbi:DJ-1/PfpI family protein [Rhodococcoides fascians]|uniref:DJ-1/PfpI family protein n=1 Tax=Rhodococcoides fascians TaxID=1828 RepID=UPI001DC042B5|nr:DJ-1/PfpI family protein [Rhodococcus fascians]CAH0284065.1 Isonitrile hydratase [Rhodococcus fascians]
MNTVPRIAVLLYPGFEELDAFGPYEVLRLAGGPTELEVHLVTDGNGHEPITASHGTVVVPTHTLDEQCWDIVIVPGGGWAQRRGIYTQILDGVLPRRIRDLHSDGVTLAAVCTGTMLLAAAGLLSGRTVTTNPVAIEELGQYGATIVDARVVDDGDIVTSGAITSGLDLGLRLVERMLGTDRAKAVAKRMAYPGSGNVLMGKLAD